jgi:Fcf2 pre-rRNA processing
MINNDIKKSTPNELTRLIPGYTAPFRLDSGVDSNRLSSLDEWTRRARHTEALKAQQITKSTSSISFKTGRGIATANNSATGQVIATAGAAWFDMRPTPLTDEVRYDVAVIRNRSALNPKRFYKSMDWKKKQGAPASGMIQVGTVVEGSAEFYSSRLTQAQRRGNVTDELLANGDAAYAQAKFKRMQQEKTVMAQKRRHTPSKKPLSLSRKGRR